MFWSRDTYKLKDNIVHTLEEKTLSYGTRSNEFIKRKINTITRIIIERCIEESFYGESKIEITIEEIRTEFNKNAKDEDIKMLDSILCKIPNKLKRWIKLKIEKSGLITSWTSNILFIRWYNDIRIDDQGKIIDEEENDDIFI